MADLNHQSSGTTAPEGRKTARTVVASGRIHFWLSGSLWIGSGRGRSDWHDHHAHQIALALDGEFWFRVDRSGEWTSFQAVIVPSHCPHQFELEGATVAHLFVEPESTEGRALSRQYGGKALAALPQPTARACADRLLDAFRANADADAMRLVARGAIASLAGTGATVTTDPVADARLTRALAYLRSRVGSPVSLAEAAAVAALSPSRFRHLFVQETGTSFRAYLLWLRINVAIEAATAGASWTEAAHEAGFADSSHLTRTHKRMFGIEPTAIRQD
jgi:AraC-like DNA-binding protein/quercetin dioxygenase-like cupin family protein